MLQMWTIKLTESMNNCCTSDRAVHTVKVNMKERFVGNEWFPENIYVVNKLQSPNKRTST